ncbi:cohesin domain-containing protein [Halovenus rubra]|uniref:Cohesin domain-containing protein n=2 Tax=Halovenus rubra TaxID=869890 RepID=A0ABD5X5Y5_9EURY|nr:cohesin domain-containing protein [Halovenus rubra]
MKLPSPSFSIGVVLMCAVLFVSSVTVAAGAYSTSADNIETIQQEVDQLYLNSDTGSPGGSALVTLGAEADNVAGYEVNLSFDPSVVQFANATGESLSDPVTNVNNKEGWVYLTSSDPEGVADPTIAFLEFRVVGETGDKSPLQFNDGDTLVNNEDLEVYEASNGEIDLSSTTISVAEIGSDQSSDNGDGSSSGDGSSDQSSDDTAGDNSADENSDSQTEPDDSSTGDTAPQDDSSSGMSTLTIVALAFAAGAILVTAIVGSVLYGVRVGRRQ